MSNIIDSIQLSGTVYTIQGSGGGSGNPTVELTQAEYDALVSAGTVAQDTYYIITDAPEVNPNDYVKKVDNNASGYTDTAIFGNKEYKYADAYNETIYWNAGTYDGSNGRYQVGYAQIYIGSNTITSVYFFAGTSNGVITANTSSSSQYVTIELVNGELAVTPNSGYYWAGIYDSNRGTHNTKKVYSSGQSKNVIENTIYDVLDTRNEQIINLNNNMITSITTTVSDGYLSTNIRTKIFNGGNQSSVLTSSTINYNNGLNVQFSSTTEEQKVLNTGSNAYYSLFNARYDTTKSYHDLTIVMNSGYTGSYTEPTFSFQFLTSDGTTRSGELSFAYNVANNSITWLHEGWGTYVTVTDTLSTDYTINFTANDGYLICYFGSNNGSIGGVDVTRPYEFVTNLITATSYIHPGQDIIDDLYANKQDTLSAGTGISIVDNVISATGGGGGGGGMSSGEVQTMIDESISGKVDTSAITSSVTSASTDNEIPTAKAVYDAIPTGGTGGGKAISAGTNISVTTGETADTVSCTLPITATSIVFDTISVGQGSGGGSYNTLIGANARCDTNYGHNVFLVAQQSNNSATGAYVNGTNNVIIGSMKNGYLSFKIPSFSTSQSVVIGGGEMSTDKNNSLAIGYNANVSGTTKTNINNQLTIDTSNQVYISNSANTSTYCVQEKIETTEAALGGLKLVKLTQSAYDALSPNYDSNTLYVIVN